MKPISQVLFLSVLLLAFRCDDDAQTVQPDPPNSDTATSPEEALFETNAIDSLCSYDASQEDANQLILLAKELSGQVIFVDEENSYALVISVDGTYDCQIIFFTSSDLKKYVDQSITFSGNILPYRGAYKPALGGQEIFVLDKLRVSQ